MNESCQYKHFPDSATRVGRASGPNNGRTVAPGWGGTPSVSRQGQGHEGKGQMLAMVLIYSGLLRRGDSDWDTRTIPGWN